MKTYWSFTILVNGRNVLCHGEETLSKAISRAITDVIYYAAVYPQAKIVIGEWRESCLKCHDAGSVFSVRNRFRSVRCPECKGKGVHNTLADIPFVMPDAAISLTMAR
jgi:hypothetical protein